MNTHEWGIEWISRHFFEVCFAQGLEINIESDSPKRCASEMWPHESTISWFHESAWSQVKRLYKISLVSFQSLFFFILSEVNPLCIFVTLTCGSKIYPIYICTRPHFFRVLCCPLQIIGLCCFVPHLECLAFGVSYTGNGSAKSKTVG